MRYFCVCGPCAASTMSNESLSSSSGSATATPVVPRTETALSFFEPHTAPCPVRPAWRPSLVTLAKRTPFSPARADRRRADLVVAQLLADRLFGLKGAQTQERRRVAELDAVVVDQDVDPALAGAVDHHAIPARAFERDGEPASREAVADKRRSGAICWPGPTCRPPAPACRQRRRWRCRPGCPEPAHRSPPRCSPNRGGRPSSSPRYRSCTTLRVSPRPRLALCQVDVKILPLYPYIGAASCGLSRGPGE